MKTTLTLHDGNEISVDIEYTAVYAPGRNYGRVEDCYPDESELNITEITVLDDVKVTDEELAEALEGEQDRIEEECWSEYLEDAQ